METTTCGENDDDDDDDENDDDKDHITVGPRIPDSLQQEYVFMPAKVRDAYLLATVRTLMAHGGRSSQDELELQKKQQKQNNRRGRGGNNSKTISTTRTTLDDEAGKARSAIVFVSTCERAAFVSGLLEQVGVANVALHSLLSQPRRLAALAKFQSVQVRVLVATDGESQTYTTNACVTYACLHADTVLFLETHHFLCVAINFHFSRSRGTGTGHSAHGPGHQRRIAAQSRQLCAPRRSDRTRGTPRSGRVSGGRNRH